MARFPLYHLVGRRDFNVESLLGHALDARHHHGKFFVGAFLDGVSAQHRRDYELLAAEQFCTVFLADIADYSGGDFPARR